MAMSQLAQLHETWTLADLQQLPDDIDWRRYEIVDEALVVSPSAGIDHEFGRWSAKDAVC
jgi:hypothetical protein